MWRSVFWRRLDECLITNDEKMSNDENRRPSPPPSPVVPGEGVGFRHSCFVIRHWSFVISTALDRVALNEEHSPNSKNWRHFRGGSKHACEVWGCRLRCDWSAAAYSGVYCESGFETGGAGRSGGGSRVRTGQEI